LISVKKPLPEGVVSRVSAHTGWVRTYISPKTE
jgi:hypothetical protein